MMRSLGYVFSGILLVFLTDPAAVCQETEPAQPEATSLLGHPLYSPKIPVESRARLEANLLRAKADFERDPNDPQVIIWLGRRTAYLGRYREAITIYSNGIEKHPRNPKLYRHRGHRYLTVREVDKAAADFEMAANLMASKPDEIEPDGMPNPKNIPRSTSFVHLLCEREPNKLNPSAVFHLSESNRHHRTATNSKVIQILDSGPRSWK